MSIIKIRSGSSITTLLDTDKVDTLATAMSNLQRYSTAETPTGKKWIDGSAIYRRVVKLGAIPAGSKPKEISTGISFSQVVSCSFISGTSEFLPVQPHDAYWYADAILLASGTVRVYTGSSNALSSLTLIVEYTK